MANRRICVFFYGLFMDAELLHSRGVSPQNIRRAGAPGFALRIGERATLWPEPNASAYGMVMELTHEEIDQLYSEDSVRQYRPEAVMLQLDDGSSVPAVCFNLVKPPHANEANAEYAAKLRELARRIELPIDYVNCIQ
jgi:Gamma-glutamyl cyclotransferase, AIG2-like